eukprot:1252490-Pleurochrysis_carterae.AAC.1
MPWPCNATFRGVAIAPWSFLPCRWRLRTLAPPAAALDMLLAESAPRAPPLTPLRPRPLPPPSEAPGGSTGR